ncbi:carboxypeptidase-like regulatory domain-containing protein [candidate division KSB1 bacterium]
MNLNFCHRIVISTVTIFLIISVSAEVLSFQANVNTAVISGTVVDNSTGEPLLSTNVYLSNTLMGTASDSSGAFKIRRIPLGKYRLVVSYIGYETEVRTVEIESSKEFTFNFRLKQSVDQMPEIVISAKQQKEWKKNLKRFEQEFLGLSPNADKCRILNPEVLFFEIDDDSREFSADALDILIIENNALGYKLKINLLEFIITSESVDYRFEPLFEEMIPDDLKEVIKWKENRLKIYKGSLKHFLISLTEGRANEEGFITAFNDNLPPNINMELVVNPDSLLVDTGRPFEKRFNFTDVSDILMVQYNPDKDSKFIEVFIPHKDGGYAKMKVPAVRSWLVIAREPAVFNINGVFEKPKHVIQQGYWTYHRIADLLPFEYRPDKK